MEKVIVRTDMSVDCPDEAILFRFAVGELSHSELDSIAHHLGRCPACQRHLAQWDHYSLEDTWRTTNTHLVVRLDEEQGYRDLLRTLRHVGRDLEGEARVLPPTVEVSADRPTAWSIGNYEVGALLRHDSTGALYEGWHRILNRPVSIKILSPQRSVDEMTVARFRAEIAVAGQLPGHDHILQAMDAGEHAGNYYYVMEHAGGIDLRHILAACNTLCPHDVAEIGRQVLLALAHLRTHHVVHLDIQPGSILLTREGTAKLRNLGLAACVRQGDTTGGPAPAAGTADYAAPERWLGALAMSAPISIPWGVPCIISWRGTLHLLQHVQLRKNEMRTGSRIPHP